MSKITLSVDPKVVERAKRHARLTGVSISQMVETYLAAVANQPEVASQETSILNSLRGSLKKGTKEDYKKHRVAKYGTTAAKH